MAWLEASLAFIITMMILSTIASMAVETIHRILRLREKGLKQTLDALFEKVIWPKLAHTLDPLIHTQTADRETLKERWRQNLITAMIGNQIVDIRAGLQQSSSHWSKLKRLIGTVIGKLINDKNRREISTLEMVERLAETEVGRHISQRALLLGEQASERFKATIVVGISDKFESFSEEALDLFSRRAKLLSVVIGFVLAFGLNVNAPDLFKSYLRDPVVRNMVIAQGEAVAEKFKAAEAEMQQSPATEASLKDAKAAVDKIAASITDLKAQSIPISPDKNLLFDGKTNTKTELFVWFLSVSLGGFLIGLGGPFWFDSFRKVSALTTLARQFTSPAKQNPSALQVQENNGFMAMGQNNTEEVVVTIFKRAERSEALNWHTPS